MPTNETSNTEMECVVYKSLKKDETYIFLPAEKPLSDLPNVLMVALGQTEMVMTLNLTADKKMARGNASEIMISIEKQGFHLQIPENPHIKNNPLPTHNERFLDKNL
ncbi:MAG: YcgL domain-containing protein [Gammaproteobacteria bacterium]|nr:YcgL domain-containing protein [Gammaproteobacteria bacterium]MCW8987628.1 YcgL domain-containing protein [Gammaproteobacteria bacterium]